MNIGALYEQHRGVVRKLLLEYEHDYDIIDELMQDVYVAAIASNESYNHRATPMTWLSGIARNIGRNHVRGASRRVDLVPEAEFLGGDVESYADTLNASRPEDDPLEVLIARNTLSEATRHMNYNMRRVINLRTMGYSNADIAVELGISTSRVSAYISESERYF